RKERSRRRSCLIAHEILERVEQAAAVVIDRANRGAIEELRKRLLHELTILQHVRHAGGAAEIVFEDVVLAVGIANKIGTGDMAPDAARRIEADTLWAEAFCRCDHMLREHAISHYFALVVQIVDEHVERKDALLQSAFEHLPFVARNNARDDVER